MIKTIIFDIGGVLTFTNFDNIYKEFVEHSGISPRFMADYHQAHIGEFLLGTINLEQFFTDMSAKSGKSKEELQKSCKRGTYRLRS